MLNIDPVHKIVLNVSAKAGSMAAVRMLYAHSGDLEGWSGRRIHEFARNLERERGFTQRALAALLRTPGRKEHRALKLVRNPFTRAVSGYLQVVHYPQLYEPFRVMAATPELLTFAGFLERLTALDLWGGDPHYRLQVLRYEGAIDPPWDYVARLERVAEDVAEINRRFGFALAFPEARKARYWSLRPAPPAGNAADTPFGEFGGRWPAYRHFYDDRTLELARAAYGPDLVAYGYASPAD